MSSATSIVPMTVACAPHSSGVKPKATPEFDRVIVEHLSQASPVHLVRDAPAWFHDLKITPDVESADYEWALKAWAALYSSLWRTSGFRKHSVYDAPCQSFVELYAQRLRDGYKAIKYLKYHTVYAFAYGTNQDELPECPFENSADRPGIWAGGWIYRTLSRVFLRARENRPTDVKTCYDIYNSKTGFPPVPRGFIEKAVLDHKASLTKAHSRDNSLQARLDRGMTKDAIKKLVVRLFRNQHLTLDEIIVPSLSACYENPVSDGGALEYLANEFLKDTSLPCSDFEKTTDSYTYDPTRGFIRHVLPDFSTVINKFKTWMMDENLDVLIDPCTAIPHAIPEPLKCRMITKGHAVKYILAMHLQRLLWRTVSDCPIFQYTAHPIDAVDFDQVFRQLVEGEVYVSGDYRASTDNIDPELTRFVWSCVCQVVKLHGVPLRDTMFAHIGQQCLTDHVLVYKDTDERLTQAWGQLMGSPMSFPILNIINYCATCVALKLDPLNFSNPIRTNGDDIGFICQDSQYEIWVRVLKNVGLERSPGKNYRSKKFLIINSELRFFSKPKERSPELPVVIGWDYSEDSKRVYEPITHWNLQGFLNQSLLYGVSKKGQDAGQRVFTFWPNLGPICESLIRGHDLVDSQRLVDAFLTCRSTELSTVPAGVAYAIPVSLGGVGLPWKFIRSEPTEGQLKRAAYLLNYPALRVRRPAPKAVKSTYADILKEARTFSNERLHEVTDVEEKSLGNCLVLGVYFRDRWQAYTEQTIINSVVGPQPVAPAPHKDPSSSDGVVSRISFLLRSAKLRKQYKDWMAMPFHSLHPVSERKMHSFVETWTNVEYVSPHYSYEPTWADRAECWWS